MNKQQLMTNAHKIAKKASKVEGETYAARLSFALKSLYAGIKEAKEVVAVEVAYLAERLESMGHTIDTDAKYNSRVNNSFFIKNAADKVIENLPHVLAASKAKTAAMHKGMQEAFKVNSSWSY